MFGRADELFLFDLPVRVAEECCSHLVHSNTPKANTRVLHTVSVQKREYFVLSADLSRLLLLSGLDIRDPLL